MLLNSLHTRQTITKSIRPLISLRSTKALQVAPFHRSVALQKKENLLQTEKRVETLTDLAAFCKRRGFIYQSSSFYGGLAGSFDYGPVGVQLKKNIRDLWWRDFVELRRDVLGIETPVILHRKVWEASGHIDNFVDPLVECTTCGKRIRADKLLEEQLRQQQGEDAKLEGANDIAKISEAFKTNPPTCPCQQKKQTWSDVKLFNLLFKTQYGPVTEASAATEKNQSKDEPSNSQEVFLRPETAQGIFINFANVITTSRKRLPLGIAQIGKSFRNEISPRDFIFRQREFEQMELEYFCHPNESRSQFDHWVQFCNDWLARYGLKKDNLRNNSYSDEECAHYAVQTTDIEYKFPFGWAELWGIANRTDFDMRAHNKFSKKGKDFLYTDVKTNETYMPHVVEPAVGVDRLVLAFIADAYTIEKVNGDENNERVVLKIHKQLAPYKFAVFPLQKKDGLTDRAEQLYEELSRRIATDFDAAGSIGQLYRRHDEIGTPYCVTVDYQTLEDNTVTIRDRDSMEQSRMSIDDLLQNCHNMIKE